MGGGALVVVLVHRFEVGEAMPEHGEGHVVVAGVGVAVGCSVEVISIGILPRHALVGPGSIPEKIIQIVKIMVD